MLFAKKKKNFMSCRLAFLSTPTKLILYDNTKLLHAYNVSIDRKYNCITSILKLPFKMSYIFIMFMWYYIQQTQNCPQKCSTPNA